MPNRNPYYDTCPDCGANLDPGERCDCDTPVPVLTLATSPADEPAA